MLSMAGNNAVDFFFYSKEYDKVYSEFESYLKTKFNMKIEDKYYFSFPKEMDRTDAIKFLELLELSFHFVVEYDSIDGLDLSGFREKPYGIMIQMNFNEPRKYILKYPYEEEKV